MPDRLLDDAKFKALFWAFIVVVAAAVLASMVALLYVALHAADQSKQNYELIQKVDETNDRLLDCTEPPGACYRAGEERTSSAVSGIGEGTFKIIVAALSCQQDGVTEEKPLANCTARRAAKVVLPKD